MTSVFAFSAYLTGASPTVTADAMGEFVVSILCLATFAALAYRRWRHQRGALRMTERRLFLVDLLLIVAGLEITFDAIYGLGPETAFGMVFRVLAAATRGGLAVGAFALLITQPPLEERRKSR